MDAIRSPTGQRDEAVCYEDVPEHADALVCLLGGNVGPSRLLVERVLKDKSTGDSNATVSWAGHVDKRVVQRLSSQRPSAWK